MAITWLEITLFISFAVLILFPITFTEIIYRLPRNRAYRDIPNLKSIKIGSKRKIQGWYTEGKSRVALIVHGHVDHSSLVHPRYSSIFLELGYDIFLIDLRNHGKSFYNARFTMGIGESEDVLNSIKWISKSKKWDEVITFGTSIGAISSLIAVAKLKKLKTKLKVMILDSMFLSPKEALDNNLKRYFFFEPFRSIVIFYYYNIRFRNQNYPEIVELLKKVKEKKIFVVHGSKDIDVGENILKRVNKLELKHVKTLSIPGGNHSELFKSNFYKTEVQSFLRKLL